MELPFITTNKEFRAEFKEVIGFVDSDIPLKKIKPDLRDAAMYLQKTVGKDVYDALIANYKLNKEGDTNASAPFREETLNELFQYSVGSFGYAQFAKANDLAHTPNGRRMRSSKDESTPWEWMVVRDNDNQQQRAFRSISALLSYMDENLDVWKASEAYKLSHKLFIRNLDEFNQFYSLESRLLLQKLFPAIAQFERRVICSRIGQSLFDALKEKTLYFAQNPEGTGQTALTQNEILLIHHIREASAYHALSWAIPRLQLNLFPEGILQAVRGDRSTVTGRTVPQFTEVDKVSKLFERDSDKAITEIEKLYLKINPPEPIEDPLDEDIYGFSDDDNFVNT